MPTKLALQNRRDEYLIYSRDWEIIAEERELIELAEEINNNPDDYLPKYLF